MMDQQFRLFVKNNISLLDELSRMYAEYRIDVCESFWEELSRTLNVDIPDGYFYFTSGKRFEFGSKRGAPMWLAEGYL